MPIAMRGGKQYNTVQERLKAAHGEGGAPTGVQSIVTNAQAIGGSALLVCATVTFQDGRIFTGLSEVPQDAKAGSAEKTNPWEVAETSAVGRALAMAGYYGSDDGLAGAEEMREAQRRQATRVDTPDERQLRAASIRESPPPRQLRPVPAGAGPQPIGTAQRLTKDAQREATVAHRASKSAAATFYDELAAIANANDLADWVAPLNVDADDETIIAHGKVLKARLQEAGLVDDRGRAVGTVA